MKSLDMEVIPWEGGAIVDVPVCEKGKSEQQPVSGWGMISTIRSYETNSNGNGNVSAGRTTIYLVLMFLNGQKSGPQEEAETPKLYKLLFW